MAAAYETQMAFANELSKICMQILKSPWGYVCNILSIFFIDVIKSVSAIHFYCQFVIVYYVCLLYVNGVALNAVVSWCSQCFGRQL